MSEVGMGSFGNKDFAELQPGYQQPAAAAAAAGMKGVGTEAGGEAGDAALGGGGLKTG